MSALTQSATANHSAHCAVRRLQPMADIGPGDFVFFKLVNDYFSNEIQAFGLELMRRATRWVSTAVCTVELVAQAQRVKCLPQGGHASDPGNLAFKNAQEMAKNEDLGRF